MKAIIFKNYEKMIHQWAWKKHRATGIEIETLVSEGKVLFFECKKKYQPSKAAFSTYFFWNLKYHNIKHLFPMFPCDDNIKKEEGEMVDLELDYEFKEKLSLLSQEAGKVINLINSDFKIHNKKTLTEKLRSENWPWKNIHGALAEIQAVVFG